MKELELARELHDQLDSEIARKLFRAISQGHARAIRRYEELRRINDGAYFLIIFATFERYINDRADVAVKARARKAAYHHRRAWETLLNSGKVNASFLNRVRLVLDQRTPDFGKVQSYYSVRNDLSHEGITSKVFSIPAVVADLRAVAKLMKR